MEKYLRLFNVLPDDLFLNMWDDLRYWEASNYSWGEPGETPVFLGRKGADELIFKEAQTITKMKLQKHFEYHLESQRVHLNAACPMQHGSVFHRDFMEPEMLTFVLYTNPSWDAQWGGETVMRDHQGEMHYCPYIPNTGVLFPSN